MSTDARSATCGVPDCVAFQARPGPFWLLWPSNVAVIGHFGLGKPRY